MLQIEGPLAYASGPSICSMSFYQVPSYQDFEALRKEVQELRAEIAHLKAAQPEWVREQEAQQLTGLSQATLARARKRPDTVLVFKTEGGLRYLRDSLLAYNDACCIRRAK
jgi:predicted mannosyl-3-phosphoglycerate phosphatase (HAD superfamily)